jgi:hypothetical protein
MAGGGGGLFLEGVAVFCCVFRTLSAVDFLLHMYLCICKSYIIAYLQSGGEGRREQKGEGGGAEREKGEDTESCLAARVLERGTTDSCTLTSISSVHVCILISPPIPVVYDDDTAS